MTTRESRSVAPLHGLVAKRAGKAIALSGRVQDVELEFTVAPGEEKREVTLGVTQPIGLDLLDIRSLGDARTGSTEEKKVVEGAAKATGGAREFRRQRLSLEAGGIWLGADPVERMFGASWQINFIPSERLGSLLQIPYEVQLQYAPKDDVLARMSTGLEISGAPLVPVNVRLIAGLGGSVHVDPDADDPARRKLFWPLVGAGLGYEHGWFRASVRYEYIANILKDSPNAHMIAAMLGGEF